MVEMVIYTVMGFVVALALWLLYHWLQVDPFEDWFNGE